MDLQGCESFAHSTLVDACAVSCKESMNTFLNLKYVNRNGTGPSLPRKPIDLIQTEHSSGESQTDLPSRALLLTNEPTWIARDADPDTDKDTPPPTQFGCDDEQNVNDNDKSTRLCLSLTSHTLPLPLPHHSRFLLRFL
ncbi:hypothetical protein BLNAU_14684 [Blattamonas nauphoetae]|uniref:Uncharacterized protein n=1 Tax=Blattamonas nauphoetae TaxID=2049346 RepID=A0ABQ9XHM9_9EUKA|nr:hypothetical protein BLNAU_14684 [Blattamonas nauphoetae]